jgi:putative ABC transport system permease protein
MGIFDLISLILDNLNRRKGRVGLTAVGVIIGTAAVVILVSLAIGLQANATAQLAGIGDLTLINVIPTYGGEGDPGGPIISIDGAPGNIETKLLTPDALEELRTLPGVQDVFPREYFYGEARLKYQRLETWAGGTGVPPGALKTMGLIAQQGDVELEKGTIVIGSNFNTTFFDPNFRPGKEPPPPPDVYNQQLRLEIIKYDPDGNQIIKNYQVRVKGILQSNGRDDWAIYMLLDDVTTYNEWVNGQRINRNKTGYNEAVVKVDDPKNVKPVYDAILALGYQAFSPQPYVEGINSFFTILQVIFGGVGAIALLVAAIGIANTMAMAILERTREIGLMKALGATNRDILSVFLGEAAGIGFLGGLGGITVGWLVGEMLDVLVVAYLAGQAVQQGGPPPPESAVITPLWLAGFALFFATIIGFLSGLYPALRAATLVPINALKYE